MLIVLIALHAAYWKQSVLWNKKGLAYGTTTLLKRWLKMHSHWEDHASVYGTYMQLGTVASHDTLYHCFLTHFCYHVGMAKTTNHWTEWKLDQQLS